MAVVTKVGGLRDVESKQQTHDGPDLSKPWDDSDVTFIIEGKKIYASKPVLSLWSPVFKAMLKGEFKEGSSEEINLPEKKHSSIMELFNVCHIPGYEVNGINVIDLLPLAREYQMTTVLKFCEQFLLTKSPSIRNLLLAREYGLKILENACMQYARDTSLDVLKKEDGFQQMVIGPCVEFLLYKVERYKPLVEATKGVIQNLKAIKPCHSCKKCDKCGGKDVMSDHPVEVSNQGRAFVRLCGKCMVANLQKMLNSYPRF